MIVGIDRKGCIQCGRCYHDECPEVFMEGEDGTSEVVEQYQDGTLARGKLPDDTYDVAVQGAEACPETVILVIKGSARRIAGDITWIGDLTHKDLVVRPREHSYSYRVC
jgi:ferredoxin